MCIFIGHQPLKCDLYFTTYTFLSYTWISKPGVCFLHFSFISVCVSESVCSFLLSAAKLPMLQCMPVWRQQKKKQTGGAALPCNTALAPIVVWTRLEFRKETGSLSHSCRTQTYTLKLCEVSNQMTVMYNTTHNMLKSTTQTIWQTIKPYCIHVHLCYTDILHS